MECREAVPNRRSPLRWRIHRTGRLADPPSAFTELVCDNTDPNNCGARVSNLSGSTRPSARDALMQLRLFGPGRAARSGFSPRRTTTEA